MNEKISVVVLIYQTEQYLKKCMDSIIGQTYENLDILCIIDGSKDNSEEIIKEYCKRDKRVRMISRANRGAAYSRIQGYQEAEGDYVIYVDSDDFLVPNMVEVLYENAKQHEADIVRCQRKTYKNEKILDMKKTYISEKHVLKKEEFEPILYDWIYETVFFNPCWGQLIRKDKMKGIIKTDSSLKYGEDLIMNLPIILQAETIVAIPEELYVYRTNENSISNTSNLKTAKIRIENCNQVFYRMFLMIERFGIKNKEKYKKKAIFRYMYQITKKTMQAIEDGYTQKDCKELLQNIYQSKEYKEIKEEFNKYKKEMDWEFLKTNFLIKKACAYFIEEKIDKLWKYTFYIYKPIGKIYKKIKKKER